MAKQQKDLRELFHDTLKDIYFAEKKILTALPKMARRRIPKIGSLSKA
jgi:ferritin-like metal-binding protein YciE